MPTSRVCFSPKTQEKGCVFFPSKCKIKGVFLSRECKYYSTAILKMFGATHHFLAILFIKGYISAKFARKTAYFSPKNWKLCWHTRIQKLGKCPPPGPSPSFLPSVPVSLTLTLTPFLHPSVPTFLEQAMKAPDL